MTLKRLEVMRVRIDFLSNLRIFIIVEAKTLNEIERHRDRTC